MIRYQILKHKNTHGWGIMDVSAGDWLRNHDGRPKNVSHRFATRLVEKLMQKTPHVGLAELRGMYEAWAREEAEVNDLIDVLGKYLSANPKTRR